jgi:hypothetical protein
MAFLLLWAGHETTVKPDRQCARFATYPHQPTALGADPRACCRKPSRNSCASKYSHRHPAVTTEPVRVGGVEVPAERGRASGHAAGMKRVQSSLPTWRRSPSLYYDPSWAAGGDHTGGQRKPFGGRRRIEL